MSYTDPQTVTISGAANTLARTSSGVNSGTFSTNDGTIKLSVAHQYGKRTRRTIRLDHSKIAADPFLAGASQRYSMSTYVVVDTPLTGYSVSESKAIVDALVAYLTASSGARVSQLLGGEN